MAAYNKFTDFLLQLGKGIHHLQAGGDSLKIYLSNVAPAAGNTVKANIAEIATGNGYTGPIAVPTQDYTLVANKGTLTGGDVTFGPAVGGPIAQFRYAILYNDTPVSPADPLICWWDYGSAVDLQIGESFKVDFGAAIFDIGP